MLIGNKTIVEHLRDDGRVVVDQETLDCALENVPHISLHTKLKQLEQAGVVSSRPSKKFYGASVFTYEGRRIKIVPNYKGESKWSYNGEENFVFTEKSDVAVDPKTRVVIACSPA